MRDYCVGLATRAEESQGQHARMIWYATLALLRCVSSLPDATAMDEDAARLKNLIATAQKLSAHSANPSVSSTTTSAAATAC